MKEWIFGPTCDTLFKFLAGSASKHQTLEICCLINVTIELKNDVLKSQQG